MFEQRLFQRDKRYGKGCAIAAGQSTAVATQLTQSINWLKQASSAEQVKAINKGVRIKHYVEAAAIACACATALILTSWTTGWVSRGRAEDNTAWADIERWNKNELQACVKAEKDTCNFHIEMPEKKKQ